MREIQDMTLNVSRGLERLEKRSFENAPNAFTKSSSASKLLRMHSASV